MEKKKVFLVCTGLGRINRGYETFTQECFDALKETDQFELFLLKGAGDNKEREFSLANAHRGTTIAKVLSKLVKKDPYFIEQFTFLVSMLPYLWKYKPDVILYSDFILGTFLWNLRKKMGLKFKLVFSNGAPNGPPFTRCDLVQQLLPCYLDQALKAGEPADKHILLPYGIKLNDLPDASKINIKGLNIPERKKVILSVGAINRSHKRMDYLIREVAMLPKDEYFLLILGQEVPETEDIKKLANQLLPDRHKMMSVPYEEIAQYYQLADIFVLCSLAEGFGRVYMEALAYGLPVLTHDYEVSRQVLENEGYYGDFTKNSSLYNLIIKVAGQPESFSEGKYGDRRNYVSNRYSWEILITQYVNMLYQV